MKIASAKNNLPCDKQYRFRSSRSTSHVLSHYSQTHDILYIKKSKIKRKCSAASIYWAWAAQSSLPTPDRVKNFSTSLLVRIILHSTSSFLTDEMSRDSSCSLAIYMESVQMNELHSLVPPILELTYKTHQVTHIIANHIHCICIPLVRCVFHSSRFFPRAIALWNHYSSISTK